MTLVTSFFSHKNRCEQAICSTPGLGAVHAGTFKTQSTNGLKPEFFLRFVYEGSAFTMLQTEQKQQEQRHEQSWRRLALTPAPIWLCNTTIFLYVLFCIQGATSFVNNEITEDFNSGGWGAALFSWSGMPLVFEGPVTVSGNSGSVSTVRLKDRPNRV